MKATNEIVNIAYSSPLERGLPASGRECGSSGQMDLGLPYVSGGGDGRRRKEEEKRKMREGRGKRREGEG